MKQSEKIRLVLSEKEIESATVVELILEKHAQPSFAKINKLFRPPSI